MKKQTPTLVIITILTLVTVIFWVGFSIINRLKTKPSLNIPDQILKPISPNLNQEILDKLETRTFFEKGFFPEPEEKLEIIESTESGEIINP
jgi:hypothetical protein